MEAVAYIVLMTGLIVARDGWVNVRAGDLVVLPFWLLAVYGLLHWRQRAGHQQTGEQVALAVGQALKRVWSALYRRL